MSTFSKSLMSCPSRYLLAKNWGILQTTMDQRGDHMNNNFEYFQIQKWMSQLIIAEKLDGKNGVIYLVSISPFRVMVLKLSKNVHFFQFWANLNKKSKYIKAIYIYASERAPCILSENVIVYNAMIYCFRDIRVWSWINLLNFCWVSIFIDILIASISCTMAQTPINHTIFSAWWNFQMHFFRQSKDHSSERKHED